MIRGELVGLCLRTAFKRRGVCARRYRDRDMSSFGDSSLSNKTTQEIYISK